MAYLAFDIGGTNIKYGVVDSSGKISHKGSFTTPPHSLADLLSEMGKIYRSLQDDYILEGIALSAPGAPNNDTGLILGASALPYLHGPNIRDLLRQEIDLPMYMENDAKSAALGELWQGAGSDVKDMIFLVLGTGVGGAVVIDGKVVHGKHLYAGEMGYMVMGFDFAKPKITISSDTACPGALLRNVANKLNVPMASLSGEEIFAKAEAKESPYYEEVELFYESLAVMIYNFMYIFDTEKIVIGGAISARPGLIERIHEKLVIIKANVEPDVPEILPPIVPCKFGGDSNLLGAVHNYMFLQAKN